MISSNPQQMGRNPKIGGLKIFWVACFVSKKDETVFFGIGFIVCFHMILYLIVAHRAIARGGMGRKNCSPPNFIELILELKFIMRPYLRMQVP